MLIPKVAFNESLCGADDFGATTEPEPSITECIVGFARSSKICTGSAGTNLLTETILFFLSWALVSGVVMGLMLGE
jgi:hypothetical protein